MTAGDSGLCLCGCGQALTGRRTKYATVSCSLAASRETRLSKTYGITQEEYNKILKYQEGKCSLCKKAPLSDNLAVDHMHEDGQVGQVMGLLCFRCNKFVKGNLSIANIVALYRYVTNPPAVAALGRVVIAPGRPKKKPKRRTKKKV